MEWVETTGRTVEEAKELALDELGVDDQEAEFEVVDEGKAGLFGLVRREARVRARVRPAQARPKVERRRSKRRDGGGRSRKAAAAKSGDTPGGEMPGGPSSPSGSANNAPNTPDRTRSKSSSGGTNRRKKVDKTERGADNAPTGVRSDSEDAPATSAANSGSSGTRKPKQRPSKTKEVSEAMDEITLDQQVEVMEDFLDGLVEAFGLDGQISSERVDEDIVEVNIDGDDLGLMIGPKGQTLAAVQELSRTVAQRRLAGPHQGRVRLDVGGYRKRRGEALTRFALQVAEDVKESGTPKVLEPMSPVDRKVVHDALNEVDGVRTASEGEDNRRRVVVLPD